MKFFFSKGKSTSVSVSNETILRVILISIGAFVTFRAISSITHQLTLIGVSFFLATALNPAVTRVSKDFKIKSRALAVGIAYIFVITLLAIFLTLVLPPLVRQTTDFVRNIPQTISDFQSGNSELSQSLHRYKLDEPLQNISHELSNRTSSLSGPILSTAGRIGSIIVSVITVLVLTFMILVEGPVWLDWLWRMQPVDERERRKKVAMKMYRVFTGYVNGQVLIAGIAALFASVALFIGSSLAGVSINQIALAGIVFLFGLIPLIGNTLAAAIVVIFCLFVSPGLAIGMAIFFLVYQQTENATLQPYIQSRSNNLTVLVVFISALVGVGLAGLLGALAAIPIAGCLKVIFDEYIVDKLPAPKDSEAEKLN